MRNPLCKNRNASAVAAFFLLAALASVRALEPTEWKNRQPLAIERAGLVKIALPPETLGLARAGLEDLRLLDPAGHEVPFVFTRPAPAVPTTTRAPRSFRDTLNDSATQLLIETGTTTPLEVITLASPAPAFLKAAQLEISADGEHWETIIDRTALFRQFGAEQLRFELQRRAAAHLRITVDDSRSRPIPFTGATLQLAGANAPDATAPIAVRIVRREEFAGESVLTLDLGGAHVPLSALEFATAEPLFARTVTLATRELREETAVERPLGTGSIWRVAAEGVPSTARLDVPVHFVTPARELLVHLANGDSPPLALESVAARQRPWWLVFRAAAPGTYAFLTGNAETPAPHYDLAPLATALRDTPASDLTPGPAAPNPGYHPPADALAGTPLLGAAIDPTPWNFRKPVQLASAGVQQLEVDLEVLTHAQPGLRDLRLVRDGVQIPYLLEQLTALRTTPLSIERDDDPRHPSVSRWQIKLARPAAPKLPLAPQPFTRLTLTSSTALFQRQVRLYEKFFDADRGDTSERPLANASWSHQPGDTRSLTLTFAFPALTDTFFLEADNGDNPPIVLTSASAAYSVARLLFKTEPAPIALYYGNRAATTPRYDLALVAGQIFSAEKLIATLGAEEHVRTGGWSANALAGSRAGMLFWGVLAIVVIGLLVVVAKLLPKPPAPTA